LPEAIVPAGCVGLEIRQRPRCPQNDRKPALDILIYAGRDVFSCFVKDREIERPALGNEPAEQPGKAGQPVEAARLAAVQVRQRSGIVETDGDAALDLPVQSWPWPVAGVVERRNGRRPERTAAADNASVSTVWIERHLFQAGSPS
jgi:hypothetical protein